MFLNLRKFPVILDSDFKDQSHKSEYKPHTYCPPSPYKPTIPPLFGQLVEILEVPDIREKTQVSAKRSLTFTATNAHSEQQLEEDAKLAKKLQAQERLSSLSLLGKRGCNTQGGDAKRQKTDVSNENKENSETGQRYNFRPRR
ncbi:MAG: hypothetical protein CMF50_06080 [Legionellales bacterium]|nr:hypothetical protein [Legionellales bacterium]|tara:strand:- start:12322 stop:12750 length:429 start_codon:yes stop_codon:yes gene_type:complete